MQGLTAKVFRTYNASITFQKELGNTPESGAISEKILAYNRANRRVAVLCNHQRAISKTHSAAMEKLFEKLKGSKLEKRLIKAELKSRNYKELSSSDDNQSDSCSSDEKLKLEQPDVKINEGEDLADISSQESESLKNISSISTERLSKKLVVLGDRISVLKNNILDKVSL